MDDRVEVSVTRAVLHDGTAYEAGARVAMARDTAATLIACGAAVEIEIEVEADAPEPEPAPEPDAQRAQTGRRPGGPGKSLKGAA